jgi:methionyl-tRNA formyltransferase
MNNPKKFEITILSDSESWINPTIEVLSSDLNEMGHKVYRRHDLKDLYPGNFCFCLSFSRILNKEIRKLFKHTLVVHASDLPSGKGWSPLTWQILEGKNTIPVSLFEADDYVDSGSIYAQCQIHFEGHELLDELRLQLGNATYELCRWFVSEYPESTHKAKTQVGEGSFYPRRLPEDSRLDVNKTIADQFNHLRVVDNDRYPAFFELNGRKYILKIIANG